MLKLIPTFITYVNFSVCRGVVSQQLVG